MDTRDSLARPVDNANSRSGFSQFPVSNADPLETLHRLAADRQRPTASLQRPSIQVGRGMSTQYHISAVTISAALQYRYRFL